MFEDEEYWDDEPVPYYGNSDENTTPSDMAYSANKINTNGINYSVQEKSLKPFNSSLDNNNCKTVKNGGFDTGLEDDENWDGDPTWDISSNISSEKHKGESKFTNDSTIREPFFKEWKERSTNVTDHKFGDIDKRNNSEVRYKEMSCYKCGDADHISRNCTNEIERNGHTNRTRHSMTCYKCGEEGHISRNCTSEEACTDRRRQHRQIQITCYGCGGNGHTSRDCDIKNKSSDKTSSRKCYKCGEEGHISRDCANEKSGIKEQTRTPPYIPPPPSEDDDLIFSANPTGINFNNYDSIPVEVSGINPPRHINNFDEAELTDTIRLNVTKSKYFTPTPVQKYSIPIINKGRDLMACAQTGSGKTAAFLLPVLTGMVRSGLQSAQFGDKQTPQAIVVGPTRELIRQIFDEARKFSRNTVIKPFMAYGGTAIKHQLEILSRGCNILIATPGRLQDLIRRGRIGLECVQYLILDEADRMLSMNFETAIRELANLPGFPGKTDRQTLFFSATFPDEVQKLAHDFLKDDFIFLTVGRVGGACFDVTQTILSVDQDDKRETLVELVTDVRTTGSKSLVFVDTKRNADFLASFLSQEELPTTSIHGDRPQREREMALHDFTTGICPIMVATSVAARGLDIPKVEHVINYDLPKEIDEYVHRIGRTGRCGNLGKATSFYCEDKDSLLARPLVKVLSDANQVVPDWLEKHAAEAIGTSFGASRGRFGARDARSGRGGGRGRQMQRQQHRYNEIESFGQNGNWDGNQGNIHFADYTNRRVVENNDNVATFNEPSAFEGFEEESWD